MYLPGYSSGMRWDETKMMTIRHGKFSIIVISFENLDFDKTFPSRIFSVPTKLSCFEVSQYDTFLSWSFSIRYFLLSKSLDKILSCLEVYRYDTFLSRTLSIRYFLVLKFIDTILSSFEIYQYDTFLYPSFLIRYCLLLKSLNTILSCLQVSRYDTYFLVSKSLDMTLSRLEFSYR